MTETYSYLDGEYKYYISIEFFLYVITESENFLKLFYINTDNFNLKLASNDFFK